MSQSIGYEGLLLDLYGTLVEEDNEGCRAYKPRAEPFEAGLARLGLARDAVLHAWDSLRSDVGGAAAAGISAAGVNPRRRPLPDGAPRPVHEVASVSALAAVLA